MNINSTRRLRGSGRRIERSKRMMVMTLCHHEECSRLSRAFSRHSKKKRCTSRRYCAECGGDATTFKGQFTVRVETNTRVHKDSRTQRSLTATSSHGRSEEGSWNDDYVVNIPAIRERRRERMMWGQRSRSPTLNNTMEEGTLNQKGHKKMAVLDGCKCTFP